MIDLARHHGNEELLRGIEGFHSAGGHRSSNDGVAELEDDVNDGNDGRGDGDATNAALTRR